MLQNGGSNRRENRCTHQNGISIARIPFLALPMDVDPDPVLKRLGARHLELVKEDEALKKDVDEIQKELNAI